uniref:Uncharacterized protein n=1 Tax=Glossina brevipalpis TaxID=37001 RepID=A0A1A9WL29_9MUSC
MDVTCFECLKNSLQNGCDVFRVVKDQFEKWMWYVSNLQRSVCKIDVKCPEWAKISLQSGCDTLQAVKDHFEKSMWLLTYAKLILFADVIALFDIFRMKLFAIDVFELEDNCWLNNYTLNIVDSNY